MFFKYGHKSTNFVLEKDQYLELIKCCFKKKVMFIKSTAFIM